MSKHSSSAWGDKPRALFKNAFILYLAAVTGCANTVHDAAPQAQAAEQPHQVSTAGEQLPELGSAKTAPASEPKAPAFDLQNTINQDPSLSAAKTTRDQGASQFQDLALGSLSSATAKGVQDWFSARHATAEMQIEAGRGGAKTGSFDLLLPVHDTAKDLFFTQVGVRRSDAHTEDYRTTVNLGVGYRHTLEAWLLGANTFYDRDVTGKNDRLGFGAEAMTDYLKLSANSYVRLSDWKRSPDLDAYLERPANGFDLRAEAFLPSYPQLGGKLMLEQYYGNQVGLFGAGDRQKDPSAVTVGVMYNPVPMVGFGLDHRQGEGGLSENTFRLSINYQFDVPLSRQLSQDNVSRHQLGNARYDLVSRNNEMVLDYKKAEHAQITLPAQISGSPAQTLSFPVTVSGGRIGNVQWVGTAVAYAQPYGYSGNGTLTLPASATTTASYTLQAIGTDAYGQKVTSNVMQVIEQPLSIAVTSSKPTATADGQDAVEFTATLRNSAGMIQTQAPISWSVQGSATVLSQDSRTDSAGQARLRLVSRVANTVQVNAQDSSGAQGEAAAAFDTATPVAGSIALVATPASITANGTDASTIVVTARDTSGQPMGAGTALTLATTSGTLSAASGTTNAQGQVTVTLTGSTPGTATVSATAGSVNGSTQVTLVAAVNYQIAGVFSLTRSAPADGVSPITVQAQVVDADYNPAPAGVTVTWSTPQGQLSAATSSTNADGVATIQITSTEYGNTLVQAQVNASSDYTFVTFTRGGQVN